MTYPSLLEGQKISIWDEHTSAIRNKNMEI